MSNRGNTSYAVSGETTEWEDILIKKGITTKEDVLLGKGLNPEDFRESDSEEEVPEATLEECIAAASLQELEEAEDDLSDERMLEVYRQQRLDQLKQERLLNRFGDLHEIKKADWIPEVTEGSKSAAVVVHLYSDAKPECDLLNEILQHLARKFKYVKFLKIKSTQAVENWPDRNLPTVFVYQGGDLQHQMMTLRDVAGTDVSVPEMEWWLAKRGIVRSEMEEAPERRKAAGSLSSPDRRGLGGGSSSSGTSNSSSTAMRAAARFEGRLSDDEDNFDLDD